MQVGCGGGDRRVELDDDVGRALVALPCGVGRVGDRAAHPADRTELGGGHRLNRATWRILFVASSAATLYASDSVG